MTQFVLAYNQKQNYKLSNDAFFYLLEEEEPLDENNLKEARAILAQFSSGFIIEDNWEMLSGTGLVKCTIIPYIEDKADFDEYENLTPNIQMQIKWLGPNIIRAWWFDNKTNIRELKGDFKVYSLQGNKCFHTGDQTSGFITGKMSLYFLKQFKKRGT